MDWYCHQKTGLAQSTYVSERLGHPTFISGLFTEGLQCPLGSETHAFSMRILQLRHRLKVHPSRLSSRTLGVGAPKQPITFAVRTLPVSHTEGHLEYKSLGHKSLIIPRAPLLALSLHPADVKVTRSEWSWKVLQSPGCWEETAASCPQPEPGRAPPCTTRSASELLPWPQPAAELGPLSSTRPRLQLPTIIRTKAQDLNPHETGQKEQHLGVRERPRMC